jgi:hypothetical protein
MDGCRHRLAFAGCRRRMHLGCIQDAPRTSPTYAGHPGPLILGARTVSGPQARQQWDATRSCDQQCSPPSRALMRARSGPQRAVNCPGRRRSSRRADTSSSSSSSPAHARQNMGRCAPVFRGRHARRRRDRPAFWAELRVLRDCAHGHHFAGRARLHFVMTGCGGTRAPGRRAIESSTCGV